MYAKYFALLLVIRHASCIVSKGDKSSNEIVEKDTISRGFSYGDEGHFGGYGAEGYDHYGDVGKYYGYEEHHKHEHKEYDPTYYKALALKGLLIPLAGVALLGAAAAFVSNPILLQLGVISSTYGRKKRDVNAVRYRDMQLLERFISQVPKEEIRSQEEKLFANYLSCSGSDGCLERLACELHSSTAKSMPVETSVMAIITNEILSNKFVSNSLKSRITKAVQHGRNGGGCTLYICPKLTEKALKRHIKQ